MLVVDIPLQLQSWLYQEEADALVGSYTEKTVGWLVVVAVVKIGSVVDAYAGCEVEALEELGVHLTVDTCVYDALGYLLVLFAFYHIYVAGISVRSNIVETIESLEVETTVGLAAIE